MVVLSTHCGVRANRIAAVASSFNISMVTLYTVCVRWIVGGVRSGIFFILYCQVLVNVIRGHHLLLTCWYEHLVKGAQRVVYSASLIT